MIPGGQSEFGRVIGLGGMALDRLMPLHLWVGPTGHVLRCGPTLKKILGHSGQATPIFTELLQFVWPRRVGGVPDLLLLEGSSLTAKPIQGADLSLRGHVVSLPAGAGALINFSLGLSVQQAVAQHDLTLNDFAPTDLTSEMLFLVEVNGMVRDASRDLTDRLQEARQAAEERALTDPLTGLRNRRAMDAGLGALVQTGGQRGFGLMRLDLDHFKQVNDRFGHEAGDQVLQHVARILREETRKGDMVARVGGDEFVLILPDCDDLDLLDRIADRILERMAQPMLANGQVARVSASIGTTVSSFYRLPQADQMLSDADTATYRSKDAGRGRHTMYLPQACARGGGATSPARSSPARH